MNFLSYSLTALTSFLGLIAGIIIISMAREEQKPGKKYFIFLQKIILLLIIILLLYHTKLNPLIFITILLIIVVYIKKYMNKKLIESYYIYPLLAFIFWISSNNKPLLFIESSLIFLYGITTASLLHKKNYSLKLIINHTSFVVIALLLFFT
jgi:hypothetical protein